MKIDIKDFTFVIPIRVDSIIRLENLLITIRYLLKNFETNILVLEAADYNNEILQKLLDKRVKYTFIEDRDPIFFRTKYLNRMTLQSKTPFIGIWDTDVIIHKDQIIDSILKLREGFEIAYPYDGHFYDTSDIIRELYFKQRDINILEKNKAKMEMIYGDEMKGGAVFVNKIAYIKAGMENKKFYGWGPEDFERYERWRILEYNIYRSKGCLFHLTHPRGTNSSFRSINTNIELIKTSSSSKTEILNYLEINQDLQ